MAACKHCGGTGKMREKEHHKPMAKKKAHGAKKKAARHKKK